jgi:hypothetical protein
MANDVYIMSGTTFKGAITFQFNPEGLLLKYDCSEATMSKEQLEWLTEQLPRTLKELKQVLTKAKGAKLQKLPPQTVDFEIFWSKYNEKVRSNKKRSLKIWTKLTKTEQLKAFLFIDQYDRNIPNGVARKYCETYLNAELWNN